MSFLLYTLLLLPAASEAASSGASVVNVAGDQQLKAALQDVEAGTTILVAPGYYRPSIFLANIEGTRELPIVIAGADSAKPPVFFGGNEGAKLSSCSYVKLGNLVFRGFGGNGINIDDGGKITRPSHHIVLEAIEILDTGPEGNNDALKMSGVDHFVLRNCRFETWGGSAIDLVGCHQGVIEGCRFIGTEGARTKNAIQIKGGSHKILVQTSFFQDAGERIINLGGATGLDFFRPPNATYEAAQVVVAGNRLVRGESSIAWVTSRDSHVHHNLFYLPQQWVGRILQETKDRRFKPCQVALFEDNLVVTDSRVRTEINVGGRTNPSSFAFRHNAWYRLGEEKKPELPTREVDGLYGVDPQLEDEGTATMRIGSRQSQFSSIGPDAYQPWPTADDFSDVAVPAIKWMPPPGGIGLRKKHVTYVLLAVLIAGALAVKGWQRFAPTARAKGWIKW